MKSYAHRCIHMMDGRIYNDERIAPEVREKRILELGGIDLPNQNDGKVSVVVDEAKKSGEEQEGSVIVMRRTEVRKPRKFYSDLL